MKSTKIGIDIQRAIAQIYKRYPVVHDIVQEIHAHGGTALLIGGAVRDIILDLPTKDIDIEVHDMPLDALEALLGRFGQVSLVGKKFGVLRVHGLDIDWSLPRSDSPGRKPEVKIDPTMPVREAFLRRDLTMNALGIDFITQELHDPFDGMSAIREKTLRTPDVRFFAEDPLRLFRVMQFISRFDMKPDETLNELCKTMDISDVSRERIELEFHKLFLRSKYPSLGIRWLKEIGRLQEILPELAATIGVAQDPSWHPEGDVFEHSMQALDAAAQLPIENEHKRLVLLYSALCHDLGKVDTSVERDEGKITSYGHAESGISKAQALMKRITNNQILITAVKKMVGYHMIPYQLVTQKSSLAAYKRLAQKLAPNVSMRQLAELVLSDKRGRNSQGSLPLKLDPEEVAQFIKKTQEADVLDQKEEPILFGRDIAHEVEEGPRMGELIHKAYEIQIEEGIRDKEQLKKRVLQPKDKN